MFHSFLDHAPMQPLFCFHHFLFYSFISSSIELKMFLPYQFIHPSTDRFIRLFFSLHYPLSIHHTSSIYSFINHYPFLYPSIHLLLTTHLSIYLSIPSLTHLLLTHPSIHQIIFYSFIHSSIHHHVNRECWAIQLTRASFLVSLATSSATSTRWTRILNSTSRQPLQPLINILIN